MASKATYPSEVFTSLKELLAMEHLAQYFTLIARNQRVRSAMGGRHASKMRGRGLDFEEVRHYVKGDDIRNIDWKVTARTQQTHTRVFREEKEKPALIIVDQSRSMFFGSVKRTKSVVAAELAALAAFRVLKQGDRVGGVVLADRGIDIVLPKRDRRNILRLFDKIVERNHQLFDHEIPDYPALLKEAMGKVRNIVTHDYLVVVISDFQRYSPDVIKFISQVAQHNDVVLFKVEDPFERSLPKSNFIAGDTETQISIDGRKEQVRKKVQKGYDDDLDSFKVKMQKYRVPVLTINTVDPIDQQLKDIFRGNKQ